MVMKMHGRATPLLVCAFLLTLCACTHLRPPDDYGWKDRGAQPAQFDRFTAASWELQYLLNNDNPRKMEQEMRNSLPQPCQTPTR